MSQPRFPRLPASQRAFILLIEQARVEVDLGEVVFRKAENGSFHEYNIPYANTSLLLLGEGTSISRDAARMLADQSVLVCFTGGGGTPLSSGVSEAFLPLEPRDEYRPTEYMQSWSKIFFDDARRLAAAKRLLELRLKFTAAAWKRLPATKEVQMDAGCLAAASGRLRADALGASNATELLAAEGRYAKQVYALAARAWDLPFERGPGEGGDPANRFLDHANYLAYGLAAVALHALGVSFSMPLLHGKTRRGALVFDLADLVKDGVCVPLAFYAAAHGLSDSEARPQVIEAMRETQALEAMFEACQAILAEC